MRPERLRATDLLVSFLDKLLREHAIALLYLLHTRANTKLRLRQRPTSRILRHQHPVLEEWKVAKATNHCWVIPQLSRSPLAVENSSTRPQSGLDGKVLHRKHHRLVGRAKLTSIELFVERVGGKP